jgi:hypothetical protein
MLLDEEADITTNGPTLTFDRSVAVDFSISLYPDIPTLVAPVTTGVQAGLT